jgi:hypothetical protein
MAKGKQDLSLVERVSDQRPSATGMGPPSVSCRGRPMKLAVYFPESHKMSDRWELVDRTNALIFCCTRFVQRSLMC